MSEQELLEFLQLNYITDLKKSRDQYCEFDCYSERFNMVIELKCRYTHYDELMLEKYKYDKLCKHEKARYINSTPKGIYIFNINKLKPEWINEKMPAQTEFENTNKINKTICFLNTKEAVCIKY
jgi:hypothetical protein